ncbi:hypothetical protein [Microbacterium sp. 13-71-7]|jgi:hypothetical protein|nr:hypothetical protein [Microbacterium sp. 13-71-7]
MSTEIGGVIPYPLPRNWQDSQHHVRAAADRGVVRDGAGTR